MKSISNRFLMLSLIIISLTIIMNSFWDELKFKDSYYAMIFVLVYGINSAGIIAGYMEKKDGNRKAIIGIIGNSILTLIFIVGIFYISHNFTE